MWWWHRAHSMGPPLDSLNLTTYSSARPRVRLLFPVSVVWSSNVIFIRDPVNSDENHSVLLYKQISQTEIFKIYLGEIMEQQKISENTAGGRISWPFGKITCVVMWNLGILYRTSILPSGTDFEKLWHMGHRQDVPEHLQQRHSSQWARCPEEGNRRARSYFHNGTPHHSGKISSGRTLLYGRTPRTQCWPKSNSEDAVYTRFRNTENKTIYCLEI